jgi:NADPH:quinone reductase-like Zn-dependent oxidoreductase
MLAPRKNQLTDIQAASLPVAAVMAWQMLERAHVVPGQTVMIHGAAGNVGAFAVVRKAKFTQQPLIIRSG